MGSSAWPAQFSHADEPHRYDTRHHAGAAEIADKVMPATHLVEVAREVEREHHLLAGTLGLIVDDAHHGPRTPLERAARPVGLQFIVLDKIDPRIDERAHEVGRFLRPETDAWLDDGADQRPVPYVRQASRALDPELRAGISVAKGSRQPDIQDTQAGKLFQLEEIASDGGKEVGQRRADVVERP
jgi:hypothetical protein